MSVFYQVFGTFAVCFVALNAGMFFCLPSSTLTLFTSDNTTLSRTMTAMETSIFGSISSIGGLISTPMAGIFLDVIGRKNCIFVSSFTQVVAWTLIATCKQVEVILLALFISGISGAVWLIVPVYTAEICQDNIRGVMTSCLVVFFTIGFLVSYILGGYLEYDAMVYTSLIMSVLGIVMICFLKESPMFLYKKELHEDAAKSIAFYRNVQLDSTDVHDEIEKLKRAFNPQLDGKEMSSKEENPNQECTPNKRLLPLLHILEHYVRMWSFIKKSRSTHRATLLTLFLSTANTFQGVVVLQVYAEPFFEEAVPIMSPSTCSVLFGVVSITAGIVAAILTDVSGRRPLMIYSSLVAGLCCMILATQLQFLWAPHWVTAVFVYVFTMAYTCGAGTVPFVLVAEVFAPEVKSFMSMLVIEWIWLCTFIILSIYHPVVSTIGLGAIFYIFASSCFISAVYSIFYLPETKGLPFDKIQLLFMNTSC